MNDNVLLGLVGIPAIVVAYALYCFSNPGSDGAIFSSVMAAVGGIIGYVIGEKRGYRKALEVVE